MKIWRIEYISGYSVSSFKIIKADMVRMSKINGDMWFCDEVDKKAVGDYLPKLIVAKGSYLSVERIEPKLEKSEKESEEIYKAQKEIVKPSGPENVEWI